ncbi:co-chaperone YbbN [Azospirillum sp. B4]|uniref:thioredoxin family protein n=1 Tax=Azospirillum sp. B4 TaxID=95605 RepID=UPI0003459C0E|nr:co-chaperone YbbN [Azospirillum sp. B4]
MQFPTSAAPGGNAPVDKSSLIKDGSDRTFMADVIEASREVPVIVDFWAPWCGPCKTLGPIIEKAVLAAKGAVKLVKIDTDQNPAIAGQLRIQSIPAVYAFFQGRPVDGFTGALPESQIKQFIDRLVQAAGGVPGAADIAAVLEEAGQLLEAGDPQTAAALYNEVLGEEPENAVAYAGLIRCLLAADQTDTAQEMLDQAPAALAKAPEIVALRTQMDLARQAADMGPVGDLERAVAADANNHQARYDLALALYAGGQQEAAVDHLLDIVKRDREWNEQAARKQLVKFFEALGFKHPLAIGGRRKLSSILFA